MIIRIKKHKFPVLFFTLGVISTLIVTGAILTYQKSSVLGVSTHNDDAAIVGNVEIKKSDFNKQYEFLINFYSWSKQNIKDENVLKRDVLERMIESEIINQYSKANNISVDNSEIEKNFEQTAASQGGVNAYLDKLNGMYGMSKSDKLEMIRIDLLKQKIQEKTQKNWSDWITDQKAKTKIEKFL